jgi:hypothetical protein
MVRGDKIPLGALMNKGLTIKTGQTQVPHYFGPLLDRIKKGDIDPVLSSLIACNLRMRLKGSTRSLINRMIALRLC